MPFQPERGGNKRKTFPPLEIPPPYEPHCVCVCVRESMLFCFLSGLKKFFFFLKEGDAIKNVAGTRHLKIKNSISNDRGNCIILKKNMKEIKGKRD